MLSGLILRGQGAKALIGLPKKKTTTTNKPKDLMVTADGEDLQFQNHSDLSRDSQTPTTMKLMRVESDTDRSNLLIPDS